jgi:RND superfamily putative drug exporter
MTGAHTAALEPVTRHGRFAHTLRILCIPIVIGWVLLTIAVNVVAPQLEEVGAAHSAPLVPEGAPSRVASERIGTDFRQYDSDTTAMVVIEGQDTLGDAAHQYYDAIVAKLLADPTHVQHVENFWGDRITAAGSQSSDAKAAYVQINLPGSQGDAVANAAVDAVDQIVADVPAPPRVKAYLTGPGPLAADRIEYGDASMKSITGITVAIIAVMLLFAYRRFSTALLMLITILIELGAARGAVALLGTHDLIGLSTFAVNVLVALTIAASADYLIFLVGRYQEARSHGKDRVGAYYAMYTGTASVVLGSGLTVAGAMYCMSFTRLPYFHTLGAGCAVALLVTVAGSLTLAPAVITIGNRFGMFDPKRKIKTTGWRRVVALIGLIARPGYTPNYNDRYYIPEGAPSAIGYRAADRHFPEARMMPEVLMIESDHDMRTPTDMLILDRVAKLTFHLPGIARVQGITRPLGWPVDHASIPFQISTGNSTTVQNLGHLKGRMADLLKTSDQLTSVIRITETLYGLTQQLSDVTHDLDARSHGLQDTTHELRDHLADFDDFWHPLRNYLYWEPHCFDIPICWSTRSLFDGLDGVDKLTDDLDGITDVDITRLDAVVPQLAAQLPPLITTLKTVQGLLLTIYSSFSDLTDQLDTMSQNSAVMGRAFDDSKNDDMFYLPPEAFDNEDFQHGLKLFVSSDGKSAKFVITHKGDPATSEGISHIDQLTEAATEAIKGTPLESSTVYLGGTAATYKDMRDISATDLMIAVTAAIALIFIVMLGITRALVASAVIVGTVALSLASSMGLSILIWQYLLHLPLNFLVIPMAVIVMLAVGSDYNLLLVSRMQEEIHAGLKTGIIRAMAGTGGVVTTAGLVFAFTMGSLLFSDLRVIGQVGSTIMIGLLFDTLVVRTFMVPAIAALLGRWFWWPHNVLRSHRHPPRTLAITGAHRPDGAS